MRVKKDKNYPYTPSKQIALGNNRFALVSPEDFEEINKHKWYAKKSFHCWYACRKAIVDGKTVILRMHRVIAKTPDGMICHHGNSNSFDNRRDNLSNMTEFHHAKFYSWR